MASSTLLGIYLRVLHAGPDAGDEAHAGAWHLPDQGAAPSGASRLVGQGSGGLGLAVWVVGVHAVQSHLRAEPQNRLS
jgi:hypothetical protein